MYADKQIIMETLIGVRSYRKNLNVELQEEINKINLSNKLLLRESERLEERFYSTIDLMPDGFGLYSPVRNEQDQIIDFQIDYVNESMCQRHKTGKKQLIGRLLSEVMFDNDMLRIYREVAETGEAVSQEQYFFDNQEGNVSVLDVRVVKTADGIAILSRDISDRKKSEEALKLAEERFSKAFYGSPYMMLINRKSDTRFIDVNQKFLSVMGLTREEVIGKTPPELGLDENKGKLMLKLLNETGAANNIESSILTKRGILTFNISAQEVEMHGEKCILSVLNDITEMKQMQIELARLESLNMVGQMAAGIAHEIRNPMTTIRGYLQLLGVKPEFNAYHSQFKLIINELDRVNSIISEFLSLAKNRPSEPLSENVNINDIVWNLYPLLEADAFTQNKQIAFKEGETAILSLDVKEISQLVLNLCRNGLEAMPERGTLTLRTYSEGGNVVLSIQDQGYGIPSEYLDKLGTPFFTTKENGTGLGLATCYRIAERYQARIEVESGSKGTIFFVRFPYPG